MSVSNPTERAHARLSASGSKRWMACAGSLALIDELPPGFNESSIHAQRGTAAHTLVEVCLRAELPDCREYEGYWINQAGDIQRAAPVQEDGEDGWFIVDNDMMAAVDVMIETTWAEKARLGPQAELHLERKFDLTWLRPDMFGTSDVTLSLFLTELVVIDYKHGQGVPVEVVERDETGKLKVNSQLGYYALGVAEADGFTHETVTLIVVQPRCPHEEGGVRRHTFAMAELLELRDRLAAAADRVKEASEAYSKLQDEVDWTEWEGEYLRPGNHCKDSFCPKLGTCRAAYRWAQEIAQADFQDDPYPLDAPTPEDDMQRLSRLLQWAPFLDGLVKAVNAHAMRAKELGMSVPDHKLVRKKANRKFIASEDEIKARLGGLVDPADLMTAPKLKSPAQIEKLGKSVKEQVNGVPNPEWDPTDPTSPQWIHAPLAAKGLGALTLAHVSDPRPEVAIDPTLDFKDDYAEDSDAD